MTYSVWMHQCERPWPGAFKCRDFHLAGPISLLAAKFFVNGYDGFSYPRQPLRIQRGGREEWANDVARRCTPPSERNQPDV